MDKPLFVGFTLPWVNNSPAEVSFKYKRLSDFCYGCGRLGHLHQACPIYISLSKDVFFGPWMRADTQDQRRAVRIEAPPREQPNPIRQPKSQFDQMIGIPPTLPPIHIREPNHTELSKISETSKKKNQVEHLGKGKAIIINTVEGQKKELCIKELFSVATNSCKSKLHEGTVYLKENQLLEEEESSFNNLESTRGDDRSLQTKRSELFKESSNSIAISNTVSLFPTILTPEDISSIQASLSGWKETNHTSENLTKIPTGPQQINPKKNEPFHEPNPNRTQAQNFFP